MSEFKSIKMFSDTIINLTPHDITYDTGTTTIVIPKNDVPPVRIKDNYRRHTGMVGPFQVEYTNGEPSVENLPDEQYSVYYIVSTLVRKQLPHRKDLLSPTTNEKHIVKNELGHTISVSYFEMNI
jgi:hypothetical protein